MSSLKKALYLGFANVIFIIHFLLVLLVTFGWLTDSLFYPFIGFLIATVLSELIFGACILSIWEFGLRRKVNPSLVFDKSCIMHYGRAIFGLGPRKIDTRPKTFFQKNSFVFMLGILLIIGIFYHFLF